MGRAPLAVVTGGAGVICSHTGDPLPGPGFPRPVVEKPLGGGGANPAREKPRSRTQVSVVSAYTPGPAGDDSERGPPHQWARLPLSTLTLT